MSSSGSRLVLQTFNQHAGQMAMSAVTLAELLHGVEKSVNPQQNRSVVDDFVSRLDVVEYGQRAAYHYGEIRADLEKRGTPIGVNDLHIAAHARSEAMVLVTNNRKEFDRVDGLRVENWLSNVH